MKSFHGVKIQKSLFQIQFPPFFLFRQEMNDVAMFPPSSLQACQSLPVINLPQQVQPSSESQEGELGIVDSLAHQGILDLLVLADLLDVFNFHRFSFETRTVLHKIEMK